MRGAIFALLLVCSPLLGKEISWYQGSVVLENQQVLVGEVSVESNELILFRKNELISVYPLHKIRLVRYYDKDADVNRKFRVVFNSNSVFQPYSLYEIVVLGRLDVVRKQPGMGKEHTASEIDHYEYFIESDGTLISLRHFKRKLYLHMVAESPLLQQFVKTEKLDVANSADVIRIVMFYNTLPQPLSARSSY